MNEAPRLAEMLRAIATGNAVDWAAVDATASDESTSLLIEELKILSRIAEVHGNARRDADAGDSDAEPLGSWGPLTILECVGRGSYGDVYRAWDTRLDREVALKLLRRQTAPDTSPVIEEGRLLARVRHPNAITVHGADCIDGRTGIWMEFIEGRTLEEELGARGPLPVAEVAAIGVDICRALAAVHKAGVVHGDIKAQNVMRDETGRIVLMDFGSGLSNESGDAIIGGTPLYLAPEVLAGGPATIRSDVYAVGVLLHHLLTGRYPIEGSTLAAVRARHTDSQRLPLRGTRPGIPKRLCAAVERAIAADPSQRYENATAFEAALSNAMKRPLRTLAVAAAIGLIVLTAALLWNAQGPVRIPFQARDWVLIAAFDNPTAGAVPDGAVEYMFERELSDSAFVNVVPRERIADALGLMAKPRDTRIDEAIGREVAIRDGSIRALLTGRIQKVGNRFNVTARIVNPAQGVVLADFSEDAATEAQLPAAISGATLSIRKALGEEVTPAQSNVAQKVAAPSLRAADLYTRAERALAPGGPKGAAAAAQLLEQATQSDPTFASAHVLLARVYLTLKETGKAADHLQRAYELSGATSERERLIIAGIYQERGLRQPAKAAEIYERLLRVYPDDYWAISNLPAVYRQLQRDDDGDRLAVRLADLRPTDLWRNWTAVTALTTYPGGTVRARPYYERSMALLEQRPNSVPPDIADYIRLYPVSRHWQEGDIVAAHDQLVRLKREGLKPSFPIASLHMTFGELAEAEKQLRQAERAAADRAITLGLLAMFRGNASEAARHLAEAQNLPPLGPGRLGPAGFGPAAVALIRLGRRGDAEKVYRRLSDELTKSPNTTPQYYGWLQDKQIVEGVRAIADGRVADGSSVLQAVLPRRPYSSPIVFLAWESLADAYRSMGRSEDARRALRDASNAQASPNTPSVAFVMRARLRLASLEREAGNAAEADRIEDSLRKQLVFADADHPIVKVLSRR